MKSKLSAWTLLPVVALALTSCAGGAATASGEEAATADAYVAVTDQQGAVPGFVGAAGDAETERCEADGDGWTAEGTVTNPETSAQGYRIYVAFNRNRDTRGLVQVDVASVAAGATESWKAEAPVAGDDLSCVLRVERFEPQG